MKNLHTEHENINFNQTMVYSITLLYRKNQNEFYSLVNHLPTYIVLSDRNKLDYRFANSLSLSTLEVDDVKHMNISSIKERSDQNVLNIAYEKIKLYDKINDLEKICSTIQRIKFQNKMNWIIGNKAIIDNDTYLNNYYEMKELYLIGEKISKILAPLECNLENWQRFQSLSIREKELLKLFANGFNNRQVSELLYISENTVRTHREQIRKKINVHNLFELIKFAEAFSLIGAL